ncbi:MULTISPECIES: iron ABC transporter permease [unclassified Streptomyces]|uniref:ABC transporter permease n=1 Tax=unclassified Streptomyces TaxID=2593676 RepID=UPI001164F433|nr:MULTISPECIES: iron ABC transporter permease [unclassified Streptomyces]QDN54467.1 iron ABC transporter permease [Streptomyces sp. S1D4-20]QDN64649.1 iron ABC transporter permease [Streptomyces sp. S1D4-14]QDO47056.1 iron ABC transporter permease [Streptomyces sp. RLB3-5]QDO57298.1 iron ABC transporter permease [Streptomyces sp. RLB1-8]
MSTMTRNTPTATPPAAARFAAAPTAPRRRPAPGQYAVWAVIAVLTLAPLVPLVFTSFLSKPYYLPGGVFSIDAYRQLFADVAFRRAAWNTVLFAVTATALAVLLGAAFAVLITRTNMPGRRPLGHALLAPLLIPPLGLIVGWESLYGPAGYLTQLWSKNLHLPAWNLTSLPGMSVLGAVVTLPIAYLTCKAVLDSADGTLEDAVRASGGGTLRVLTTVTVPMLRTALLDSGLLIFTLCLEVLGIPLFLGRPANIQFIASYLYDTWSSSSLPDPPVVSAGAILLLVVASVLLVVRGRLLRHSARYTAGTRATPPARPLDLGPWRIPAAVGMAGFVGLTCVIPLLGLVLMSSVTDLTTLVAPWHLWTAANWDQIWTDPTLHRSITNSLTVAAVGSAATVALVALATVIAHHSGFRLRRTLPALLVYPRATPGIVFGVGFFWLFLIVDWPGALLRNSLWGELLALSVRNMTLAYIILAPALARISPELAKAAATSGASWWTTTRRITLPLLRPALLSALVLMFVTLVSDYDPVVFLTKPGTELLGTTMLQTWSKGLPGPVAAMALVQGLLVAVALAAGLGWTLRKKGRDA